MEQGDFRVTVLIEDTPSVVSGLTSEHGLSLFVETPEEKFLFDCGHTGAAWDNAGKLGIDLSGVRFVVLSHSHYDHAGGFPALLRHEKPQKLYTGPGFWQEKFSHQADTGAYLYKGCGFRQRDLTAWGVQQEVCEDLLPIGGNMWLIHGFSKKYPFETIPSLFVCGDAKKPDEFVDEICLVLGGKDGLTIITGCSHNGILNIVSSVRERLQQKVCRVIGGIHLTGQSPERIDKTLGALREAGVEDMVLGHCSGVSSERALSPGTRIEWC